MFFIAVINFNFNKIFFVDSQMLRAVTLSNIIYIINFTHLETIMLLKILLFLITL